MFDRFSARRVSGTVGLALGLAVLAGCKPAHDDGCNLDAVAKLGADLDGLSPEKARNLVWPRLEEACRDALTPEERHRLGGESLQPVEGDGRAAKRRALACGVQADGLESDLEKTPANASGRAYEVCDLERFGVMTTAEVQGGYAPGLTAWGVHAWLVEQGAAPELVAPITRALFAREQRLDPSWPVPAEVELPVTGGKPFEPAAGDVLITIHEGAIAVDGQEVTKLSGAPVSISNKKHGELWPLYERLSGKGGGGSDARRIVIAADESLKFVTLFGILQLAALTGIERAAVLTVAESGLTVRSIDVRLRPETEPKNSPFVWVALREKDQATYFGAGAKPELVPADAVAGRVEKAVSFSAETRAAMVNADLTIDLQRLGPVLTQLQSSLPIIALTLDHHMPENFAKPRARFFGSAESEPWAHDLPHQTMGLSHEDFAAIYAAPPAR